MKSCISFVIARKLPVLLGVGPFCSNEYIIIIIVMAPLKFALNVHKTLKIGTVH